MRGRGRWTHHSNAIRRRDGIPRQKNVIRRIGRDKTQDNRRNGHVNRRRELHRRPRHLRRDVNRLVPPRICPQRTIQRGRQMPHQLPLPQAIPMRHTPIRIHTIPIPEPRPPPIRPLPTPSAGELDPHRRHGSQHHAGNGDKFGHDKEVVEPSRRLGADRVGQPDQHQDPDRQQLVRQPALLPRHARGRVNALDKHDTQNGQRRRHNGDDPRPSRQESKHVTINTLQKRLHAAWETSSVSGR